MRHDVRVLIAVLVLGCLCGLGGVAAAAYLVPGSTSWLPVLYTLFFAVFIDFLIMPKSTRGRLCYFVLCALLGATTVAADYFFIQSLLSFAWLT